MDKEHIVVDIPSSNDNDKGTVKKFSMAKKLTVVGLLICLCALAGVICVRLTKVLSFVPPADKVDHVGDYIDKKIIELHKQLDKSNEDIKQKLAAQEKTITALKEQIANLPKIDDILSKDKVDELSKLVTATKDHIDKMEKSALIDFVNNLYFNIDKGEPFKRDLNFVISYASEVLGDNSSYAAALRSLAPYAEKGVPTNRQLIDEINSKDSPFNIKPKGINSSVLGWLNSQIKVEGVNTPENSKITDIKKSITEADYDNAIKLIMSMVDYDPIKWQDFLNKLRIKAKIQKVCDSLLKIENQQTNISNTQERT